MQIKNATVQGYKGVDITYKLITTEEGSGKLVIMLPGIGYTVQRPLFHYATAIYLKRSFDILQVNYTYNDKFYEDFTREELDEALKFDTTAILNDVLKNTRYEDFIFYGKSLGTIAMSSVLNWETFSDAKAVWLTPLLKREDVFETMRNSSHSALCFIGDKDPAYVEIRYNQLLNKNSLFSKLIPDADHSLEDSTDPLGSIDILKNIMLDIERF